MDSNKEKNDSFVDNDIPEISEEAMLKILDFDYWKEKRELQEER